MATAAEPGKILHEVRTGPLIDGLDLPPVYYGTVDATPLWISLLHDAWCWGLGDDEVARVARPAGSGHGVDDRSHEPFLSYRDESGRGLSNQGWKDSGDSIQDAGGGIAEPPITLCEVQGYALPGGARRRPAARRLRPTGRRCRAAVRRRGSLARFREQFWVDGPAGPFPAVALDGQRRPVDSLTSNIGHLPATGILDDAEVAAVAAQIARPCLDSGYGLRTLADDHPRYNPLGYHTGTVWPHDTAIAIDGLARTGHGDVAGRLAAGLLARRRRTFDHRLPELFGGWPASAGPPLAYPASCRPQAWAAAAALVVLRAALGLHADVPAGTLTIRPDAGFAVLFPLDRDRAARRAARPRHPRRRVRLRDRRTRRTADARDLTPTVRPCSAGTCGCSPPPPTSHARRAGDVTPLVGAVVALAAISLAAFPPLGFSRAVVRFLASFPPFLDGLWQVLADLLVVLALRLLCRRDGAPSWLDRARHAPRRRPRHRWLAAGRTRRRRLLAGSLGWSARRAAAAVVPLALHRPARRRRDHGLPTPDATDAPTRPVGGRVGRGRRRRCWRDDPWLAFRGRR